MPSKIFPLWGLSSLDLGCVLLAALPRFVVAVRVALVLHSEFGVSDRDRKEFADARSCLDRCLVTLAETLVSTVVVASFGNVFSPSRRRCTIDAAGEEGCFAGMLFCGTFPPDSSVAGVVLLDMVGVWLRLLRLEVDRSADLRLDLACGRVPTAGDDEAGITSRNCCFMGGKAGDDSPTPCTSPEDLRKRRRPFSMVVRVASDWELRPDGRDAAGFRLEPLTFAKAVGR